MIRMASMKDIDQLIVLAGLFYCESNIELNFNEAHLEESFKRFIEMPEFCLIVIENQEKIIGMLVGAAYPNFFSGDMQAQEMLWFIDNAHRRSGLGKELLKNFEAWALSKGAKEIAMVALRSLNSDKVAQIYKSLGYKEIERSFVRVL